MALRRARRSEFTEYRKMQQVRNFIDANPQLFMAGQEFNVDVILNAFEIPAPVFDGMTPQEIVTAHQSHQNKRCQWQNRFNRVLAQRGMYMTKRYNHNLWLIRTTEGVEDKISAFTRDSRRNMARSTELRRGLSAHHNQYRHVPDTVLQRIVAGSEPADWSNTDYVDPART